MTRKISVHNKLEALTLVTLVKEWNENGQASDFDSIKFYTHSGEFIMSASYNEHSYSLVLDK